MIIFVFMIVSNVTRKATCTGYGADLGKTVGPRYWPEDEIGRHKPKVMTLSEGLRDDSAAKSPKI